MAAKQIIDRICYEEWEFDTSDELEAAAKKEACVCGDSITRRPSIIKIYNYHQQGVRWIGRIKKGGE
jgi:hypothetical protein